MKQFILVFILLTGCAPTVSKTAYDLLLPVNGSVYRGEQSCQILRVQPVGSEFGIEDVYPNDLTDIAIGAMPPGITSSFGTNNERLELCLAAEANAPLINVEFYTLTITANYNGNPTSGIWKFLVSDR
jgi:hypothetical protein